MHNFGKLKVYHRALELTRTVRSITESFPRNEIFGLTSQFRRASYSIVLNITEGAGNSSAKEFSRFLQISVRSCYECLGCLDIARVNELLDNRMIERTAKEINEIASMIIGLKRTLQK